MGDQALLELNQKHLGHNYYTDVITFDYSNAKAINCDIAVSPDRVSENATLEGVSVENELARALIHGILHCVGYSDKTPHEKQIMRNKEDEMLIRFHVEHKSLQYMFAKEYDVIVVGAGHAGSEAAAAAANMGSKTLLITMNLQNIAQMSCNPAMGGIAKGQILREIDALGGYSGIVTDNTAIQFKMLNKSKGPAMWSPRAQSDRMRFAEAWRLQLEDTENVDFFQEMVTDLLFDKERALLPATQPLVENMILAEKMSDEIAEEYPILSENTEGWTEEDFKDYHKATFIDINNTGGKQ